MANGLGFSKASALAALVGLINVLNLSTASASLLLQRDVLGPATVADSSCAFSKDPFEKPARIGAESSDLAGQCLNTDLYRAPVDLQIDEVNQTITFKNYHYRGGFWAASIPARPGAIADAIVEIKKFQVGAVMAAHTHLRFRMTQGTPITIVNQITGEQVQIDDIAVSWEAALVKGVPFNIAKAALPVNPIVGRVGETATIFLEAPRPHMEQYVLNLSAAERVLLLKNALQRSANEGTTTWYNTLHPNCTTEIFDVLDTLPRLRGRVDRFVVSASSDPVAGPTVQALVARNLISQRIQNFEDEMKGNVQTLRIPDTAPSLPPFLPSVSNFPWSIVIVAPSLDSLKPTERAAMVELKKDLLYHLFKVMSGYFASKMISDTTDNSVATDILLGVIRASQNDLSTVFAKYKNDLPEAERSLSVYFAPYAGIPASTSLAKLGLDVSVPFPLIEEDYDASGFAQIHAFKEIYRGGLETAAKGQVATVPAYLMAAGLTVHVRKNSSFAAVQLMFGLNSKTKLMEKADKQVHIHQLQIPDTSDVASVPTAVITSFMPLPLPAETVPNAIVNFGAPGKIVDHDEVEKTMGLLQVKSPIVGTPEANGRSARALCVERSNSTPVLVGNLGDSAMGDTTVGRMVNPVVDGSKIFFKIFSVTIDLAARKAVDIDVRTDVPPASCLTLEEVNTKFKGRINNEVAATVNAQIMSLKAKLINLLPSELAASLRQ
jgi:hypothetical protein